MANYANQKRIKMGNLKNIEHKQGSSEPFFKPLNIAPIKEAMRLLNGNAFKLYIYLLSWDGANYYDFSPSHISKDLKISDEGARTARDELVRQGFLIKNSENIYEFFPISQTNVSSQKI